MKDIKLYYTDPDVSIKITLKSRISLVSGNSATGKSLFANKIKSAVDEMSVRSIIKTNIDLDKTVVVLDENDLNTIYNKDKHLIIIDRFDKLAWKRSKDQYNKLDTKLIDFINKSNNVFILMSRDGAPGLMITSDCLLIFENTESNSGVMTISSKSAI